MLLPNPKSYCAEGDSMEDESVFLRAKPGCGNGGITCCPCHG